jgi:DNA polymerase-3 subunit delta
VKYDNLRAFEKHLESAAPQHFAPIYTILAKEEAALKEAAYILIKALLPDQKNRDLHLLQFHTPPEQHSTIFMEADAFSLFASKQVIWLQQADKFKKEQMDLLLTYLQRSSLPHYLIFSASNLNKNSLFYKVLEKEGVVLELSEMKPWEKEKGLMEWLQRLVAKEQKVMAPSTCQLFIHRCGVDVPMLQQELYKLFCYVGERQQIVPQDIEAICVATNTHTIWQLGEALFYWNSAVALNISHALLRDGQPLLPLLRQLRSQFQTHYQIATVLAQGGTAQHVIQDFPYMKGQILEKHLHMVQSYGLSYLKKGLLFIDAAEIQAKTVSIEDDLLIECLLIKLTQK